MESYCFSKHEVTCLNELSCFLITVINFIVPCCFYFFQILHSPSNIPVTAVVCKLWTYKKEFNYAHNMYHVVTAVINSSIKYNLKGSDFVRIHVINACTFVFLGFFVVVFLRYCPFSFGHRDVCSSIYGLLLPHWYIHTIPT